MANMSPEEIAEKAQQYVGQSSGTPTVGRDPVNMPMIRHLTDALGDRNPVYTDEAFAEQSVHGGVVAPATSLQVWTMGGLAPRDEGASRNDSNAWMTELFDENGYVGVVATNCEQVYHRYVRPGDLLSVSSQLESVVGPKQTALGEGFFVTNRQIYRDQNDEIVGEMLFRILKFRPANVGGAEDVGDTGDAGTAGSLPADFPPPPRDAKFFWDGLEAGELRIERCTGCDTLRHPPRPVCPHCRSLEHDHVVASGRGEVYSYVLHHHPPVPGREHPFAVAVVELEEGTRIIGNVVECDPNDVHVGMPVEVVFTKNDIGRTLPQWRPRQG